MSDQLEKVKAALRTIEQEGWEAVEGWSIREEGPALATERMSIADLSNEPPEDLELLRRLGYRPALLILLPEVTDD